MSYGNTVDRSPPDPRLKKTPRSPGSASDTQDINEDIRQTHKIYHFQNCGTVSVDSFNARGVTMENCGNTIPQVTCSSSFSFLCFCFCFHFRLTWPCHYLDHHPKIIGNENVIQSQSHAIFNGTWAFALSESASTIKHVEYVFPPL